MKRENPVEEIPPFFVENAYAGSIVYPPGSQLGPRIQNDLQLVLLHTGAMTIFIDQIAHRIPVGTVALLKPGHLERFVFAKNQKTWHRWITVTPSFLDPMFLEELERQSRYAVISDRLNALTDFMIGVQNDHLNNSDQLLCSLGQSAVWLYINECRKKEIQTQHPAVLKVKEVIAEHYIEGLSLNRLAVEAGVTPEHLIRLFRKHEQMTPIKYLWQYRLDRGLEMLRNTGLQVEEIAYRSGFKTSYHFARVVKRSVGRTPTQIRRESWNLLER